MDESFLRGLGILAIFVPTSLNAAEHDEFGARLWVDELWWWLGSPGMETKACEKILYIFARLARDSPGYVDFTTHCDHLFTILISSLKLEARSELVPSIIRILAFLSPGIIIPFVLDIVYPALQTTLEPHRLTQSLHILAVICVPLVRDDPRRGEGKRLPIKSVEDMNAHLISYRRHAIIILNNILPGIDINDIVKSSLVFQGTLKRALNEFKRTHQDEWHAHKLTFTEDQLLALTDVMISPSYYV